MIAWISLTNTQKQTILTEVANRKGISEQVVEKDVWVTLVLEALFGLPEIGDGLVFKGGTSLSKAYDLIDRFSEDIDFAIDRSLLGFTASNLSNTQIKKLRLASSDFIKTNLVPKLRERLLMMGVPGNAFKISWDETLVNDTDPLPVNIEYASVGRKGTYLASDRVILEIGARSLLEPTEKRQIKSLIADIYPEQNFAGRPFEISTVLPSRTFLEKLFLLHEQFLQPDQKPPRNRMSRHLYDIEKLMSNGFDKAALENQELFEHIVAHRKQFTPIKGISYEKHTAAELNIIPPDSIISEWEKDYSEFVRTMVIGESLEFSALLDRLKVFQDELRKTVWQSKRM